MYTHLKAYNHDKGAFGVLTAPSAQPVRTLKQIEHTFLLYIDDLLVSSGRLKELKNECSFERNRKSCFKACCTVHFANVFFTFFHCEAIG